MNRVVLISGDRLDEADGGIVPDWVVRPGAWPEEVWSSLVDALESLDEIEPTELPTHTCHISTGRLGVHGDAIHILGRIDRVECTDGCHDVVWLDQDAVYDAAGGSIPECPECGAQMTPTNWDSPSVIECREDARDETDRLQPSDHIVVILPDETGPADEDLAEWLFGAAARGVTITALDWCERPHAWPVVQNWAVYSDPVRALSRVIQRLRT